MSQRQVVPIYLLTSNLEINKQSKVLDYSGDFNVMYKQSLKKTYTDRETIIHEKPSEAQIVAMFKILIMSSLSNLIKDNSNSFRIMKGEPYHKLRRIS